MKFAGLQSSKSCLLLDKSKICSFQPQENWRKADSPFSSCRVTQGLMKGTDKDSRLNAATRLNL